jgi:hypothetical protein
MEQNNQLDVESENPIDLQLVEDKLRLAKKQMMWNASRSVLDPCVQAFTKLGLDLHLETDYINLSVTGDAKRLGEVVRILRIGGFNTAAARPKIGDTSWCAFWKNELCPVKFFLNFTSSVCRRIKVGTRLVEEDVFETKCGDISSEMLEQTQPSVEFDDRDGIV